MGFLKSRLSMLRGVGPRIFCMYSTCKCGVCKEPVVSAFFLNLYQMIPTEPKLLDYLRQVLTLDAAEPFVVIQISAPSVHVKSPVP